MLSSITSDDLVDELEDRGYIVVAPGVNLLSLHSTEELQEELVEGRYWQPPPMTVEDAIDFLRAQGYNVNEKDKYKDFLWDLYCDIIVKTPEEFVKGVNEILKKDIHKWL